ncbi:MAG: hypothetical protein ABIR92_05770 [Gemmatimonadaceae bacterium]
MSNRLIATLFILALAPATAAAQFTTFISPPNPVKDSIKAAVVAEQKATVDSVTRAQIANMKTWVDSAAGIVVPPTDTAFVVKTITGDTVTPVITSSGMVAPNTASPVPFLLVTGVLGMLLGIAMVRRPQPKPSRAAARPASRE